MLHGHTDEAILAYFPPTRRAALTPLSSSFTLTRGQRRLTRISHRVAGWIMKECLSSVRYWSFFQGMRVQTALGVLWLVFFPSARTCSNVVPATLFGREHALKGKILRHCHAPR